MAAIAAAALLLSAYVLVRRRLGLRTDESLLLACLLACLEATASLQLLGWAGRLTPLAVGWTTGACFGIHLALAYALRPAPRIGHIRPLPRWLVPALAAAVLTLGARLLLAWLTPPDGWDSLGYHLPFVVRWIRQGSLDLSGWPGTHRWFAWNGELLSAWLALLDGGRLGLAKLPQTLALPILGASGSILGRFLAGSRWAAACALAFVSLPVVLIQAGIAYVDVLYAAFWTAAVAASVAWARTGRTAHLAAFAAAAGLAAGAKSPIFFLAPLAVIPAAALAGSAACRRSLRRGWLASFLLVLIGGAGSYIRNAVLTGNPIFPFGLSLGGLKIFHGIASTAEMPTAYEKWFVASPWGWLIYPFKESVKGVWGYTHLNGFGPLFALGWLLLAAAVWTAFRKRDALLGAFLSLFPAVLILFFALQPVRLPRYIIFLAPIPLVGLAAFFGKVRGRWRKAARTAWTLAIVLGCAGVWAYLARQPGYRAFGSGLLAGHPIGADAYYRAQYGSLGKAWAALDAVLEIGDTVAVSYGELLLPWFGNPPRADVRIVPLGRSPYPGVPGGPTEAAWLAAVEKMKARYLVVWTPAWAPEAGRRERACALNRPDRFEPLAVTSSRDFGRVDLFRVRLP